MNCLLCNIYYHGLDSADESMDEINFIAFKYVNIITLNIIGEKNLIPIIINIFSERTT